MKNTAKRYAHFSDITLPELGTGAGLCVWGLRALISQHEKCFAIHEGFQRAVNQDAVPAIQSLKTFARSLGSDGRRKILLSAPGHIHMTNDEVSIVASLSAAQDDRPDLMEAHLSWILAGRVFEHTCVAAKTFADIFSHHKPEIRRPETTFCEGGPSVLKSVDCTARFAQG